MNLFSVNRTSSRFHWWHVELLASAHTWFVWASASSKLRTRTLFWRATARWTDCSAERSIRPTRNSVASRSCSTTESRTAPMPTIWRASRASFAGFPICPDARTHLYPSRPSVTRWIARSSSRPPRRLMIRVGCFPAGKDLCLRSNEPMDLHCKSAQVKRSQVDE